MLNTTTDTIDEQLRKTLLEKRVQFIERFAQGELGEELIDLLMHLQEQKQTFGQMMHVCELFYRELGEREYTDIEAEKLCRQMSEQLNCDNELAAIAVSLNDYAELIEEAMQGVAEAHLKPSTDLAAQRELRDWKNVLKEVFMEDGGLGAQQADIWVRRFVDDVRQIVDEHYASDKADASRGR